MTRSSLRVILTGSSGFLGSYLGLELLRRGHTVKALCSQNSALPDRVSICPWPILKSNDWEEALEDENFDVLIHLAAISSREDCGSDPEYALQVNASLTRKLAGICARKSAHFIFSSSDMVYDGALFAPKTGFFESYPACPNSPYANSKFAAEKMISSIPALNFCILRLSLLFGAPGLFGGSTCNWVLKAFKEEKAFQGFTDEWRRPLDVRDACEALALVAESSFCGLLHIAGPERMSRFDMLYQLATLAERTELVLPCSRLDYTQDFRPPDLSLNDAKFQQYFQCFKKRSFTQSCEWTLGLEN